MISLRLNSPPTARLISLAILLAFAGCQTPFPCDQRHLVADQIESRIGSSIGVGGGLRSGTVPISVSVEDGLSENEAVALCLWNNATYHELLSQLGVSRARLFDAGLISDPQLVVLFPIGPKQLEFTTFQAIDALWLRPIRQRAAELDLSQLAQQLVQNGLDVARDTRVAHANLLRAQDREELTREAQALREEIAALAEKRLEAGDISELEVSASRIEALQAEAAAASAAQDVLIAKQQLMNLIGVLLPEEQLRAAGGREAGQLTVAADELVLMAHAMRPDLRAIEIQYQAACQRAELARNQVFTLDAIFDANGSGDSGFEAGPGLRMTLPFFNGNRGGIAIADAQVEQVDRQYTTLRDRIELEVRTAVTQFQQANEQDQLIEDRILPALAEAEELSRKNYENGGVPYLMVLQTTGQYIDAKLRKVDARAGIRRAVSELERSVGRKLELKPAPFVVLPPAETESTEEAATAETLNEKPSTDENQATTK